MLALLTGLVIAFFDQWTKQIVRMDFTLHESRPVVDGFFNLTYIRNTGAAWGLFGGQNAALILLSLVMLVMLVFFRRSFLSRIWEHNLALGLMLGGIVGNLFDRWRLGWVTDFLDFYWRGHHWPAFNIADAAICGGVVLYILSSFWVAGHPLHETRIKNALEADKKPAAGTEGPAQ